MDLWEQCDVWLELSHDMVIILDAQGRIVQGNDRFQRLTGHLLPEIIGQDWFEACVHPASSSSSKAVFTQVLASLTTMSVHNEILTADTCRLAVDWRMRGVPDVSGQPAYVVCVGSHRVAAPEYTHDFLFEHARLIALNKELTCLHAMSRIVSNVDGTLEEVLSEILNTIPPAFQYPEHTGVRLTLDGVVFLSGKFSLDASCHMVQDVLVHKVQRGRLRVSLESDDKDSSRHFLSTEQALLSTLAKHIGWVIAKREALSTQRNLERQLRHADRLAKIGQFAAGIAHELNEPLANILGFAQLAGQMPALPETVYRDLDNIVKSALYSREVIKKLMIFGRQIPLQKSLVNLNCVVQDTLHFIELNTTRSNIALTLDLDPNLPEIWADPQHLKQVVVNLVVNAIQAMSAQGVLTIQTQSFHNDVYLIIADTGKGMEAEVLKQIFNPFFTTKPLDQGTGLGLAVVHGIVSTHAGIIDVESTPGQGTRFEITFSCADQVPGAEVEYNSVG
ncbi:MAG: ATP-binding protein [Desulfomicrobium sp.]|nr:ATP-binding protein [Desulfomicrobium sp.]